ncbi:diguanylate cyclase [Ventosimonas gracilis]|uniref:Diguanylate cyclase n=1 Tax=Ventosimonas gracilis TaxID=1680762 RepID=A0A139SW88_9GAMM|nr:EAL domain-containing protein [Ventosimonas gracilis]KXU38896.1 diguanylate cyclase [Ventosimonas gracilis]
MPALPSSKSPVTSAPILLVVDDLEANLEAMRALLGGDKHWQLRSANSGEAALRCLLAEDVSLVLLDVQMPGMDGYEVAELMRSSPKTRYTPIIFVSAIARTQELILRGYSSGAVDFILKPFDPPVLLLKVKNLLAYESNRRELQRIGAQLERQRAFSDSVLNNAAEGIMVVDEHGQIQYANPTMAEFTDSTVERLQKTAFCSLIAEPKSERDWQASSFYQHWQKRQVYRLYEAELQRKEGASPLPVALSCAPLPPPQRAMVIIARDISVERELRTRLEALIISDPLTGLLNRRGFYLAAESALERAKRSNNPFAVIYLDLDGFKRINDSLGHAVGDELLCQVGKQLKTELRAYDALARIGGDEFTILLDALNQESDAARIADKLLRLISIRHQLGNEAFSISASAGIVCYPQGGDTVEGLLRAADMAMYEAKQNRSGYHFHSPQMTQRAKERLKLEQSLRQAVEQQQFSLLYQPQFYLQSGALRGFEALLRWTQGNTANISPLQFIPLLEETHLINPLGEWIFAEGLSHLKKLREQLGSGFVLSLNVSPVQFAQPQLVENLTQLLHDRNIASSQLEVEVTESTLMSDMQTTQKHLSQLRELGVKVAVDDFGTGYSSLAYLRQFDVDSLKIDRLFIANMLSSRRDAAIISTIIDLAKHLELEVIAEGVETEEQRKWLLAHQCSTLQGWLVAPALPLEQALQVPRQLSWNQLPLDKG